VNPWGAGEENEAMLTIGERSWTLPNPQPADALVLAQGTC
jgi:hypothetical protein